MSSAIKNPIHAVECDAFVEPASTLLPGEISGLVTLLHRVPEDAKATVFPEVTGHHRIMLVLEGAGTLRSDAWEQHVEGLSVAIPRLDAPLSAVPSPGSLLTILELRWAMVPGDAGSLARAHAQLPYFLPYAAARPYSEAIKSAQTVSRTLVPTGIVPRFAAGSVETRGPDAVGEHAHPMLEQLFLGLPGNDCTVTADGQSHRLGACTLLHIPLGSVHGVRVADGAALHYIWLDFFRDAAGEAWIADMHRDL